MGESLLGAHLGGGLGKMNQISCHAAELDQHLSCWTTSGNLITGWLQPKSQGSSGQPSWMMMAAYDDESASFTQQPSRSTWSLLVQKASLAANNHAAAFRILLAAAVGVGWMCASSLLILVNKRILKDLEFGYPMTVASMGMATSAIFSWILCHVTKTIEAKAVITPRFWLWRIMPIGFFMAATLWAGNLVYLYLSVSFIQMLKAFTPIITMLALFVARLETPSSRMIGSVLGIAAGTALAAYGEVHNSVLGVVIMFVSEACEAIRLVMTQLLLTGLKMGPFEGVMWLSPACFLWLTLGAVIREWPTMLQKNHQVIPGQHIGLFTFAACTGFAVNVLAYATIKLASSLTLKVLGCVKNALVIVAAMLLFAEEVTLLQGIGYLVSTVAFVIYTHIKMSQIAQEVAGKHH